LERLLGDGSVTGAVLTDGTELDVDFVIAGVGIVPGDALSDQYDLKLQIAGLGGGHDRVVVRETDGAVSHWYYAGDRLLAVDALNDPRSYMIGKRLIEAGKHPAPELITDPATDMKALLKS